ncbi:MAG: restriction endonuclease [Pseudomonas sp.]
MDDLAGMPWPVGFLLGIGAFCAVRYAVPWWLERKGGALAHGIGSHYWQALEPLAWLLLAMCWMGALLSYVGARHRRALLDTRTTLESLAAPGWRQFEILVGEAFRRQGYAIEETGLGGPDGGIDLILRRQGQRVLVQCKQWRRRKVGVSVVREMAGLLGHHQADAVKIVCIGTFTRDAEAFAKGKPITLVGGEELLAMIENARSARTADGTTTPRVEPVRASLVDAPRAASCIRCGSPMTQRTNRRTGELFLGCSQFPRCRGTSRA